MSDIQSELGRLKTAIDEAKSEKAKLEGRSQELLNQLKTDFKLDSISSAEKEIVKLKNRLEKLDEEISKQYDLLKEKYEW
jgi:uncharacterized membrane-anchored protein YhcB (DUF1043 family)